MSGIKDRVPLSNAHLKFPWHSLWWKKMSSCKTLHGLSPKLIFCDSGAQSVTLKLFWCIYLLSAVSDDRLHTLIWFSMKGHFNLKTLVHGLAITLRCSSHFKETHERRCLNLLFLAVNNPARVSCPPLGPADQWLTGNHSGLSFQVIDVGPKRCCSVSCLFPGYPLNLRISF